MKTEERERGGRSLRCSRQLQRTRGSSSSPGTGTPVPSPSRNGNQLMRSGYVPRRPLVMREYVDAESPGPLYPRPRGRCPCAQNPTRGGFRGSEKNEPTVSPAGSSPALPVMTVTPAENARVPCGRARPGRHLRNPAHSGAAQSWKPCLDASNGLSYFSTYMLIGAATSPSHQHHQVGRGGGVPRVAARHLGSVHRRNYVADAPELSRAAPRRPSLPGLRQGSYRPCHRRLRRRPGSRPGRTTAMSS